MEEELEVLDAILGQALKVEKDILRLTIQLEAKLGQITKLVWHQANLEEASNEVECLEVGVKYLPPVKLVVQLTPAYPASAPPEGSVQADWLPSKERERLAMLLTQVWQRAEGEVVIWDWVQEVQEQLEILLQHGLELVDRGQLEDMRAYDERSKKEVWQSELHECNICFDHLPGSTFISLPCGHHSCRPCLVSHATVVVEEGGARPIPCPFCGSELDAVLVRELLEEDVWEAYDNRLLTKAIRSMSGAVWCPLLKCQQPAQNLPHSSEGPRLGKCPVCLFVFCLACNKASHGAADCNSLQQETAVVEKVKGDQKESEAANKDYEVFHGMLKKSGPKRTQEFLNVVVQDIFGGLDMDDKMELVKRYSRSPEDKENLENEYGAAYIEYFVNRFSTGGMDNFRFSTAAFTTFLTTIREKQSDSKQKSLFIGEHAMHWLETRQTSGGIDLRPCPTCFVPIEKYFGCHHMQCTQCGSHFCWDCLQSMEECSETRCNSA